MRSICPLQLDVLVHRGWSAGADVAACPTADSTSRCGPGHYRPAAGHGTTKRCEIPHHQLLSVSVFEIVNIAFRKLGVGTADAIFQIS